MFLGECDCAFRVAVNSVKGRDEDRVERTDWVRVMLSGGRAKYLGEALHKGSRVLVIGRYEIGEWTTREGEVRASHDIWADDVQNLSPREDGGSGRAAAANSSTPTQSVDVGASDRGEVTELDDLPF